MLLDVSLAASLSHQLWNVVMTALREKRKLLICELIYVSNLTHSLEIWVLT